MGDFSNTITFDPILGINDLTSVSIPDLFVAKFGDRMLGLHDHQLPQLAIYPNPCQDMVNIDFFCGSTLKVLDPVILTLSVFEGEKSHVSPPSMGGD